MELFDSEKSAAYKREDILLWEIAGISYNSGTNSLISQAQPSFTESKYKTHSHN